VNKRHLDMVYKPSEVQRQGLHGSVTAPERAADSLHWRISCSPTIDGSLTGAETTIINLINVNSPMTYDSTMLGAAKVYADAPIRR